MIFWGSFFCLSISSFAPFLDFPSHPHPSPLDLIYSSRLRLWFLPLFYCFWANRSSISSPSSCNALVVSFSIFLTRSFSVRLRLEWRYHRYLINHLWYVMVFTYHRCVSSPIIGDWVGYRQKYTIVADKDKWWFPNHHIGYASDTLERQVPLIDLASQFHLSTSCDTA